MITVQTRNLGSKWGKGTLLVALLFASCSNGNGANNGSDAGTAGDTPSDAHSSDSGTNNVGQWLHTSGNHIYQGDNVWLGRGANIHDTRSCNACTWDEPNVGEVKRRLDELIDVWGANFVRLNLESYLSDESYRNESNYKTILDDPTVLDDIEEIVDHIGTKPGAYVLLSLWLNPYFTDLGWPTEQSQQEWIQIATRFAQHSHVLFGLVNEPEENFDGSQDEQVWKAMNDTVQAIRGAEVAAGAPQKHIITVQGTRNWARYLEYYIARPITAGGGENIAYESHVYFEGGTPSNPEAFYADLFGEASQTLPVIIGEYGSAEIQTLVPYAEARQISHLAWTFHMRCPPNLIEDRSEDGCGAGMALVPTAYGQQLIDLLK